VARCLETKFLGISCTPGDRQLQSHWKDRTSPQIKEVFMGWGRTLLLGNIGAQLNIDDVEADVDEVKQHLEMMSGKDASRDGAIDRLQRENHDLKIYIATLLRLLVSKNVLTSDELTKFVDLLDPQ